MKFETHCHTHENDIVVGMNADEIVAAYHEIGYDGMVITNHFFGLSLEWYKDILDGKGHKEIIDYYLRGYRKAKETGDALGMTILMGIELRFDGTINDYLVYGIDEDFLYASPLLNAMSYDEFFKILPGDAIVCHAHPFRNNMTVTDPQNFFGIEVYNGGTNDIRNEMADIWADKYNLRKTSGSDFHHISQLGKGGIVFDRDVHTESEFVEQLKTGDYRLIKNGIVV